MCGIIGIFGEQAIDLSLIQKMNDKLIHRGPDGSGYLCSKNVANIPIHPPPLLHHLKDYDYIHFAFGHRRLAINDLSQAGNQPMSYLDRYWIIFNGEIYNFVELKADLKAKGYQFNSHSDTEVVMAAYDYWGVDCLNKFNGDWAFALIDIFKNKILISRDRFGVKPLYYFAKNGLFIFSSEIKGMLDHPEITKEPNINYVREFINNGPMVHTKETAFKEIYCFDFASYFHGDVKDLLIPKNLSLKRFWSIKPNLSNELLNEEKLLHYSENYLKLLTDAVKIRLRSDVKVGSSLSGGLDSSSIVYLINKQQQNIETFSSVYKTPGTEQCDESYFINHLSQTLKIKSHQIEPDITCIPNEFKKMIYHLESPIDTTLMSSWHTYKLQAYAGITVTLDGQGADEQMAGYLNYLIYYFSHLKLSEILKNYKAFRHIPQALKYIFVGLYANMMSRIIGKRLTQWLYHLTGKKEQLMMPAAQKLHQTFNSYLVQQLFLDDRASMAHSVEIRAPFIDYRLVEFLSNMPISYKLAKGWTKYFARFTFAGLLPDTITWRKEKMGWPVPDKFWLKGAHAEWCNAKIMHSTFLREKKFFGLKGFKNSFNKKIKLLNLAIWYEVFFAARS